MGSHAQYKRLSRRVMFWMASAVVCVPAAKLAAPLAAPYVRRNQTDVDMSEYEMDVMFVDRQIKHMLEEGLLDHEFNQIPAHDTARRADSKRRYEQVQQLLQDIDDAENTEHKKELEAVIDRVRSGDEIQRARGIVLTPPGSGREVEL